MSYQWEKEGFWITDGHCWFNGLDLGQCPKDSTGEVATIPYDIPFLHRKKGQDNKILLECNVYRVQLQEVDNPVEYIYLAIGEYKGFPVLYRDENTMEAYMEHLNKNF